MTRFTDVIVINDKSEILLLTRNPQCEFMPGKLCLPGGHLEEGVELIDNAKKELEEETGLVANHLTKVENYDFADGQSCTTIFVCFTDVVCDEPNKKPMLCYNEHIEYGWYPIDKVLEDEEIKEQLMPELDKIIELVLSSNN